MYEDGSWSESNNGNAGIAATRTGPPAGGAMFATEDELWTPRWWRSGGTKQESRLGWRRLRQGPTASGKQGQCKGRCRGVKRWKEEKEGRLREECQSDSLNIKKGLVRVRADKQGGRRRRMKGSRAGGRARARRAGQTRTGRRRRHSCPQKGSLCCQHFRGRHSRRSFKARRREQLRCENTVPRRKRFKRRKEGRRRWRINLGRQEGSHTNRLATKYGGKRSTKESTSRNWEGRGTNTGKAAADPSATGAD